MLTNWAALQGLLVCIALSIPACLSFRSGGKNDRVSPGKDYHSHNRHMS